MSFKILFMGTPSFSVPILKSINSSNHKILEVYTQPPKKKIGVKKLAYLLFINILMKIIYLLDILQHLFHKWSLNTSDN